MTDEIQQDELTSLKAKADLMGIKYSPNIGVESLRKKINEELEQDQVKDPELPTNKPKLIDLKNEALKLVRVTITPMDAMKKDYQGEIITVSNNAVGTVKRFVPFNVETHIENIIYEQLKDRKCQVFVSTKTKFGNVRQSKLINAYGIVIHPQLTEQELEDLKKAQQARGSVA